MSGTAAPADGLSGYCRAYNCRACIGPPGEQCACVCHHETVSGPVTAPASGTGTPGQAAREALHSRLIEALIRIRRCESSAVVCVPCRHEINEVMEAADAYASATEAVTAAAAAQPAPGDEELLKQAADKLWACAKAALTVEHSLDKPYDDDPRWSPWTRWVERPAREAHDLAMVIRKRLKHPPAAPAAAPELAAAMREARGYRDALEKVQRHLSISGVPHSQRVKLALSAAIAGLVGK